MGSNTKKVNLDYWLSQIELGKRFRKKYAKEIRWPVWRSYYRGNWCAGIMPLNMFFTMVRTVVPKVYFRNPGISIVPGKPGPLNAAFAKILERVDNKLARQMGLKRQIKKIVQDTFMFGTGFGKVGFGAQYTPTPTTDGEAVDAPVVRGNRLVEYNKTVMDNMPWFMRIPTGQIIVPNMTSEYNNCPWVAHEVHRNYDDVKADPRFKNTSDLTPTRVSSTADRLGQIQEQVVLYEVRDRQYGRVIVFAEGLDKPLFVEDDEFQRYGDIPIYNAVFNEDDEVFWGVPDSVILEPQQLEINEIRTQSMKHRRLSLIKILAQTGGVSQEEVAKMTDEGVGSTIWVNDINAVKPMQAGAVPNDLYTSGELVKNDVREQIGFSRNQFGEFNAKSGSTATEAQIVQLSSEIRVDERRDILADMITNVYSSIHRVIFNHWSEKEVIDISGPGGVPLWVEFTGEMLSQGSYEIKVDPDTTAPATRGAREAKAVSVYNILKENPLIDPIKLTQYLLRELHGVDYDDLMRGLPQDAGASPSSPLNVGQLGQVMQQGQRLGIDGPTK